MPRDMRGIVLILQHDSVSWAKLGNYLLWNNFSFSSQDPYLKHLLTLAQEAAPSPDLELYLVTAYAESHAALSLDSYPRKINKT